mmetsp:Transcript_14762/g.19304  ORF Transcript_14762/g.19304 Transcript_14762/m.19304 type:complete len:403 (+) Transcript_14762:131-1339(+)|eukprot:CAMPEP_0198154758 /NCGR_PEP_ID=MMETSP1443-20131203/68775_1 /TAXON_ID=186043 /ORGANISM="Entomoneis sp., Strain CCMP2396" /LENGTH=402 /DNA_ID=CAMNT_0043821463 /DNA_START=66 /DNA_END=1274 /DNA_ORIENTATION=+
MTSTPSRNRNNGSQQGTIARLIRTLQNALSTVLSPLVTVFRLLLTGRTGPGDEFDGLSAAVTAKASQQFVSYLKTFHNSIGSSSNNNSSDSDSHEAWSTTGFSAAQEQATQQQSLLLIYLHSPLHRSSEAFCKQVLCHDSMLNFINQPNISALGVSIHTAQGAYLAQLLHASCFPFLALLQPKVSTTGAAQNNNNSGTMSLVMRAEGPALTDLSVQQLLPHFQTTLTRHQVIVSEAEMRRLQRQEESDLRRQQDEEYQATLEADQERERQKREAGEREVRRLREQQEEEERQQVADAAKLDNARAQVPPEPPTTGASGPVTTIRFVLPSGTKLNRRFYSHESIRGILAYLIMYFYDNEIDMSENIGVSTSFPKKSYNDDPSLTLEEAGLAPQAVLMVQDLDV